MNYDEFVNKLVEYEFINSIWSSVIEYILKPIYNDDNILKLFAIYFSYIEDGSTCMPLDDNIQKEWQKKCKNISIKLQDETDSLNQADLEKIKLSGEEAIKSIACLKSLLSCDDKLFKIENNFLFSKKYYNAKEGIKNSILRLFNNFVSCSDLDEDIKSIWPSAKTLQLEVIKKGINNNLIITGGPGTGKTSSVFYLLLMLLKKDKDYKIYLTAPSGKASSRIKESINEAIKKISMPNYQDEIDILKNVDEYTIHRLLGIDFKSGGFIYNSENQFDEKSIFVIDEASMIDICLFDSLLEAIPTGARVFILGDRYQLPSVECGAVLADLLQNQKLDNFRVELKESNRFKPDSAIAKLSQKVNCGKEINDISWKGVDEFEIQPVSKEYPVFYYDVQKNYNDFVNIINKWSVNYYSTWQKDCTNVKFDENKLDEIYQKIDEARILTPLNKGRYGAMNINNLIKKNVINALEATTIKGYYPGILLMITQNNNELDLYNGDTGVIVRFENSDVLFLLIEKNNEKYQKDSIEVQDRILKLGKYMLYPLRMIDLSKTSYAYAITIHKAQGSGYNNIMVILPDKVSHPLLNRQILYTAITRTKGNTYIISSSDRFNEAIKVELKRYTRIFD